MSMAAVWGGWATCCPRIVRPVHEAIEIGGHRRLPPFSSDNIALGDARGQ